MTQPIDLHGLHEAISEFAEMVKGWDIGGMAQALTCSEATALARVLVRARETESAALLIYYHGFTDVEGPEPGDDDVHHDVYLAAQTEFGTLPIQGEALRLAYQHVAALVDEERGEGS